MNLAQYREVKLPKVTRDCLIPPRSTVLNQGWYGTTWAVEFLCDGVRCKISITLDTNDLEYGPESVEVVEARV